MTTKTTKQPPAAEPIYILHGLPGISQIKKPPQREVSDEALDRYIKNHGIAV